MPINKNIFLIKKINAAASDSGQRMNYQHQTNYSASNPKTKSIHQIIITTGRLVVYVATSHKFRSSTCYTTGVTE